MTKKEIKNLQQETDYIMSLGEIIIASHENLSEESTAQIRAAYDAKRAMKAAETLQNQF